MAWVARATIAQPVSPGAAAPLVVRRADDDSTTPPPDRTLPAPPANSAAPNASAGHRLPDAPSATAAPRTSDHVAANAPTLLDGVRGGLVELGHNGQTALHLQLSPPELGTVRMQLVAHDQQVDVRLVVQNDAARHVLTGQADTLRERLGTLGVALGRFDVRQDGGSAAQREQAAPEPAMALAARRRRSAAGSAAHKQLSGSTGIDVIV